MTVATPLRVSRGDAVVAQLPGAGAPTPFQSAGWCRAWIAEAAAAEGAAPLLLRAATAAGRPVYAGLQVHSEPAGKVLRPLCWPWADYHRAWWPEGEPEPEGAAAALAAALAELQRIEGAALDLQDVAEGDLLHRAALLAGARSSPASPVVAFDLTDAERVAAVLGRKETVRKARLLARRGRVELIHWRDPADLRERLPVFFAMHAAQWRDRPDVVAPFDGGPVDRTFAAAAQRGDCGVVLSELRLESVPLAMYYGFLHQDRYWAYRTAFDQEYRRLSPGYQLVAGMIRDFVAAGVTCFDLMRGDYPYKADYAEGVSHNVRLERAKP
ncbi:GNAT family N-acetyltransferase [Actinacidiphila sp. bgisy145]|uniref:GNAT family N-acetyltransferase n=1 Tax=Actinacidiphila sp. bgisy145 TaxID=3413792 RepID=UPI003EB8AB9E